MDLSPTLLTLQSSLTTGPTASIASFLFCFSASSASLLLLLVNIFLCFLAALDQIILFSCLCYSYHLLSSAVLFILFSSYSVHCIASTHHPHTEYYRQPACSRVKRVFQGRFFSCWEAVWHHAYSSPFAMAAGSSRPPPGFSGFQAEWPESGK